MLSALKEWVCGGMPKPITKEECKRARKRLVRNIVSKYSRGNISLRRGKFITTKERERLRQENKNHDFCKK
jgi:hypothetical protein